jgi:prefoldin subunit 5
VKELEYDVLKECEDVYEDFDDEEDLIDSCEEGMQEAIEEMEDYCD